MGLASSPSDQCCAAIFKSFVFFVLVSAVGFTEASIHIYDRDPFREVGTAYLHSGGSEGIAASGSARSYIRFENITFWRSKEAAEHHPALAYNGGLVQVVIFEASDRDNIGGSPYGGQRSICCTPDLAKLEGCKQGEVIRTPSATDKKWPVVVKVYFRGNTLSTQMKKHKEVEIKSTGMYNLFFITCDPELKGLRVTGRTVWRNPTGFLPGRMAPLMKFYIFMSIAYAILCGIWVFQYVRHWNDVLLLQHCITSVIALGLLEMTFWYFDYAYFNSSGTRPVGITTWVVTIGSVRKTISRILILSVAMGYGVVRPTLGGLTTKVLLVGVTYFVASEMLNIAEYVGSINDIAGRTRVFFVLPVAFLDAFLISWIFSSLSKTLEQLQAKRSSVKLEIYRKFSNALAVTIVASVVWIGYEVYFKASDPFNERWQNAWIITAFWDILAFALLSVICYLWAPSQSCQRIISEFEKDRASASYSLHPSHSSDHHIINRVRYAYMDNHEGDTDDEETESLYKETSKGSIGLVKQGGKDDETSDLEEEAEEGKTE